MRNERESRRRGNDGGTPLLYLLLGGAIGATVALLFAPKSGQELRGDIADATRKGIDRTRETATQVGSRAGEYYESTRERAGGIYAAAADKAGELTGAAREAAARKTGTLSAAIAAGKRAYEEEKRKTELSGVNDAAPTYYEEKS
jgi:gas vesicle protein